MSQCVAITVKGKQCKREATWAHGKFCWCTQHYNRMNEPAYPIKRDNKKN